jgi:hypothetical protein
MRCRQKLYDALSVRTYSWDVKADGAAGWTENVATGVNPTLTADDLQSLGIAAGGSPYQVRVRATDIDTGAVFTSQPTTLTVVGVDLSADQLAWDGERGAGISDPQRGVDFAYTVSGVAPTKIPTVAFYWAQGPSTSTDLANRIGGPLPLDPKTTAFLTDPANWTVGAHSTNDPARGWGPAPAGATHLLMVIDPPDETHPQGLIPETDETNNATTLRAHSADDILWHAVQIDPVSGATITAHFRPGSGRGVWDNDVPGQPVTMSEAEVVLGVDHFNWVQQITSVPTNWEVRTLVNVDYTKANNEGVILDGDGGFQYRDKTPIESTPQHTPFYDPLVTFSAADDPVTAYTRAFIVHHPDGDQPIF